MKSQGYNAMYNITERIIRLKGNFHCCWLRIKIRVVRAVETVPFKIERILYKLTRRITSSDYTFDNNDNNSAQRARISVAGDISDVSTAGSRGRRGAKKKKRKKEHFWQKIACSCRSRGFLLRMKLGGSKEEKEGRKKEKRNRQRHF